MRGSVLDVMVIPIIVFILAVAVFFTFMFLTSFNTIAADVLSPQAQTFLSSSIEQYKIWDQGMIILVAGMFIVTLIGAAMIDAHPMFFVGALLMLIVFIFTAAQLANIFLELAATPGLVDAANEFPYTLLFYQNLPMFIMVFTVLISIVMFSFGGKRSEY